jgi:acyl carrier protein
MDLSSVGVFPTRPAYLQLRLFNQENSMNIEEVRAKIKEIISDVANIAPENIADNASFVDDLDLDSLSLLEIGVDMDYQFKLGVPEEQLQQLRSLKDSVDLVMQHMNSEATAAAA